MIFAIESSIPTFKTVRFHEGLNVLLTDSAPDATHQQTRNSAGKTSLIEIIHFLLGSDCDKDSLFRNPALIEHSFRLAASVRGKPLVIERTGSDPSKIWIIEGYDQFGTLVTRKDKTSGRFCVSNTNWRIFLGHEWFGLPANPNGTIYEEAYTPTFRALFPYFARRRNAGAFLSPERHSEKQQRYDWQTGLSYLLGLDWEIPFEFNKVRGREKNLEELRKAAKAGTLGQIVSTVAQLRPKLTVTEAKAARLREEIEGFHVLESYRDLSHRAAILRTEMQKVSRAMVSLNETLEYLRQSLEEENPPEPRDLKRLYEAAGVELPNVSLKRYEDVHKFYASVISNRRGHLEREIADIRSAITAGELRMKELDNERSDVLKTLEGRGALDDFLKLQRELASIEAEAATLRERYKTAEFIEGEGTKLELDRVNLKRRLQEDFRARQTILNEAILLVAETIAALYADRLGKLEIDATDNGPEFRISIEGDRGGGIASMEIYCFDLMLFRIASTRFGGPEFLIHDSHLFDGVDERQIAIALHLGALASEGMGRQYIATLNSDIFDRLPFPPGFDRNRHVLSTRLSDETDTGGLFGFRFE